MALSEKQQVIIDTRGKAVVKACPGSGKTYSVAARIANLLKTENFHNAGIAAISFTNTAWEEINDKLKKDFKVDTPLSYPHFIGTIDSFLNKYVFLPHGHLLIKGIRRRPTLVGEPHMPWSGRYYMESFFDKISINIQNEYFDKVGSKIPPKLKNGKNTVYDVKKRLIQAGFCNQSDANYISLKILQKYPLITQNLINRFSFFIMDEAQDTNDIQMAIIDELVKIGLEEIMLIGDPNQAIYEWNNANPKLFEDKFNEWQQIPLDENRRSSSNICNATNGFIGQEVSIVFEESEVKDYAHEPETLPVDFNDSDFIENYITPFIEDCIEQGISVTPENVAVLY